jgi:hypothetical protein
MPDLYALLYALGGGIVSKVISYVFGKKTEKRWNDRFRPALDDLCRRIKADLQGRKPGTVNRATIITSAVRELDATLRAHGGGGLTKREREVAVQAVEALLERIM